MWYKKAFPKIGYDHEFFLRSYALELMACKAFDESPDKSTGELFLQILSMFTPFHTQKKTQPNNKIQTNIQNKMRTWEEDQEGRARDTILGIYASLSQYLTLFSGDFARTDSETSKSIFFHDYFPQFCPPRNSKQRPLRFFL